MATKERENSTLALIIRSNMDRYGTKVRDILVSEDTFDHSDLDWNDLDDPRQVAAIFNSNAKVATAAFSAVQDEMPFGLKFDELKEVGGILASEYQGSRWARWKDKIYEIADRFGAAVARTISDALVQTAKILRVEEFDGLKSTVVEPNIAARANKVKTAERPEQPGIEFRPSFPSKS